VGRRRRGEHMSDRVRPVVVAETPERVRTLIERVPAGPDGTPPNLFLYMGRHETLFPSWFKFTMSLLTRGSLPPRDREIVILRTAARTGSDYELAQHVELGSAAGLSAAEIAALVDPNYTAAGSPTDLLVQMTDELVAGELPDSTWAALSAVYAEQDLMELTMLVSYYQALAKVLLTFRVPLDAGRQPIAMTSAPETNRPSTQESVNDQP
jgi:4-carboxymuconolactone decarboxylase